MKEKIIEQSILLFEKKGFSETSIQDIVDELGVTKGTFYYYFKSKEDLLMDIHNRYISQLLQLQTELLEDVSKNNRTKLHDLITLLITDIKVNGPSARVYFREIRHLTAEHAKQILEKRNRFRLNIQRILENGVQAGEFRKDLQVDMITFGILGMVNWSYQWFKPNGKIADQQLANIFSEMILKGIEASSS